jgi:polyhydroxyalkanoate synthesis regulator phasin
MTEKDKREETEKAKRVVDEMPSRSKTRDRNIEKEAEERMAMILKTKRL